MSLKRLKKSEKDGAAAYRRPVVRQTRICRDF
jgi:hypothetical protein